MIELILMTLSEAAELLQQSYYIVHRLVEQGALPIVMSNGKKFVLRDNVVELRRIGQTRPKRKEPTLPKMVYTVAEACTILSCHRSTLYTYIQHKWLEPFMQDGHVCFTKKDIDLMKESKPKRGRKPKCKKFQTKSDAKIDSPSSSEEGTPQKDTYWDVPSPKTTDKDDYWA